jgi:S1-C subfamily serine protease
MTHRAIVAVMLAATGARASVVVPEDPQTELKSVADRLHSTVIEVRAQAAVAVSGADKGQELLPTASFGTGVLLGNGLAMTTLHTVGAVLPGRVAAWKNVEALVPELGPVAAEIVAWFPELDLALLRLPGTASLPSATLSAVVPSRGAPLLAMGAADDSIDVVGVMAAGMSGDVLLLTSNRSVDSRYWGGPVFDTRGQLVGVTLPSWTPKAIGSAALAEMLDSARGK